MISDDSLSEYERLTLSYPSDVAIEDAYFLHQCTFGFPNTLVPIYDHSQEVRTCTYTIRRAHARLVRLLIARELEPDHNYANRLFSSSDKPVPKQEYDDLAINTMLSITCPPLSPGSVSDASFTNPPNYSDSNVNTLHILGNVMRYLRKSKPYSLWYTYWWRLRKVTLTVLTVFETIFCTVYLDPNDPRLRNPASSNASFAARAPAIVQGIAYLVSKAVLGLCDSQDSHFLGDHPMRTVDNPPLHAILSAFRLLPFTTDSLSMQTRINRLKLNTNTDECLQHNLTLYINLKMDLVLPPNLPDSERRHGVKPCVVAAQILYMLYPRNQLRQFLGQATHDSVTILKRRARELGCRRYKARRILDRLLDDTDNIILQEFTPSVLMRLMDLVDEFKAEVDTHRANLKLPKAYLKAMDKRTWYTPEALNRPLQKRRASVSGAAVKTLNRPLSKRRASFSGATARSSSRVGKGGEGLVPEVANLGS